MSDQGHNEHKDRDELARRRRQKHAEAVRVVVAQAVEAMRKYERAWFEQQR